MTRSVTSSYTANKHSQSSGFIASPSLAYIISHLRTIQSLQNPVSALAMTAVASVPQRATGTRVTPNDCCSGTAGVCAEPPQFVIIMC